MRLEATIAPANDGKATTKPHESNLSAADVQVITATGMGTPSFDQICINGQNHGQIIVVLGGFLFTIEANPDGKGMTVSGLKGRLPPTASGHTALKAECKLQSIRTITKESSSMVIIIPDFDQPK